MTAFQYLSADLQMPTPRIDTLAPGVMSPTDEPVLPAGFYMGLGDSQTQADAATAQAQHDAALQAIAARQVGDFARYQAAIAQLYSLGIRNATAASDADLQQIADSAQVNLGATLGGASSLMKWLVVGLGLWVFGATVGPLLRSRRG